MHDIVNFESKNDHSTPCWILIFEVRTSMIWVPTPINLLSKNCRLLACCRMFCYHRTSMSLNALLLAILKKDKVPISTLFKLIRFVKKLRRTSIQNLIMYNEMNYLRWWCLYNVCYCRPTINITSSNYAWTWNCSWRNCKTLWPIT